MSNQVHIESEDLTQPVQITSTPQPGTIIVLDNLIISTDTTQRVTVTDGDEVAVTCYLAANSTVPIQAALRGGDGKALFAQSSGPGNVAITTIYREE